VDKRLALVTIGARPVFREDIARGHFGGEGAEKRILSTREKRPY